MDKPDLPSPQHFSALTALARINFWSRSASVLAGPVFAAAATVRDRPVRVLDVATGAGDVPIRLERLARRKRLNVNIDACDVSPRAIGYAQSAAVRLRSAVRFFLHDVIRSPLPGGYDVVTCSLFLHHLSDDAAVTLMGRMGTAGRIVLVNDLVRSRFNLGLVWLSTRILTQSAVVRFDGPASVRAAYTPAEAKILAARAGLTDVAVTRRHPCRFLLTGTSA